MLDIKSIRDRQTELRATIAAKRLSLDLDELLETDDKRRQLLQSVEALRAKRNEVSKLVPTLDATAKAAAIADMKVLGEQLDAETLQLKAVEAEFDAYMVQVPTIMAADTPAGLSDADNVEVETWGEHRQFDFPVRDHIAIAEQLGLLDFERGVKVAGFRGYYVTGPGVLLMMGFMMYALQKMASRGYQLMIPPTLIKEFGLFGSGYFKGLNYNPAEDEIFQVNAAQKNDAGETTTASKFLVGTAEPSLLAYYADEILPASSLPVKLAGFSPCYRSEIGSYGRDTKGLYRVHEFFKVEQVVIAANDLAAADQLQAEMMDISKELHRDLGLPYRVLRICAGDLSAGKYKQFDLEAWMPGRGGYGETGSSSNFVDWQARRLNVRYRSDSGEVQPVYMLNNTALPSPRIFIAILENYQQADGSVVVPEVLRPFVGADVLRPLA